MKKILYHFSVVIFLFSPGLLAAKKMDFSEEKKIIRNYEVNVAEKLNIENEFGQVVVNTWDKNEIAIEITIKASSKSPSRSLELLNSVKFMETRAGGSIYLKTDFDNLMRGGTQSVNISYLVKMPVSNALSIVNKFGNVYMGSFKAPLNLSVSYGNIKAEKLTGGEKRIAVNFGAADIEEVETGSIESKYSRLDLLKIGKVDVKNSFGKTVIGSANNLRISQKYGDLEIKSVYSISATVDFSNVEIKSITKSAELILKYASNADLGSISGSVDLLKIDAGFSTIRMKFDETAAMNFDVNLKYGDFKLNNVGIKNYVKSEDENKSSSNYKGKIGKGGDASLRINSNYTNIYFE